MPRQGTTQTRSFTYDTVTQRLAAVQTPESGTVTYVYNPDGTVQSKTDAKGQVTRYTYDALQRVTETDAYAAGASVADPCQTVTYTYDIPTLLVFGLATNGFGRLTGMYSPGTATGQCLSFAEEYSYAATGQVLTKRMTVRNTDPAAPPIVRGGIPV